MNERLNFRSELRASTSLDGSRTIEGLIPYNSRSFDLGNFVEVIAPGAFAAALKPGADILCLRDHDQKILLGRTKSGTLTLTDSPAGLRYNTKLPKTTQASDLAESIDRGDLDAASFGFVCPSGGDTWTTGKDGIAVRTLNRVDLHEISPCSFAAYPSSAVSLRSCPPEIRGNLTVRAHGARRLTSAAPIPVRRTRLHGKAARELENWRANIELQIEVSRRLYR